MREVWRKQSVGSDMWALSCKNYIQRSSIFVGCLCYPPDTSKKEKLTEYLDNIFSAVAAEYANSLILFGGDFNHYDFNLLASLTNLSVIKSDATRGTKKLHRILTNIPHLYKENAFWFSTRWNGPKFHKQQQRSSIALDCLLQMLQGKLDMTCSQKTS